jgi:molybdate-binding protein
MADVGMGVEPPAREFKLEFLPVAAERYFLMGREQSLSLPAVQVLLELLRGPRFGERVARLPGYSSDRAGEVTTISQAFPWLSVKPPNNRKRRAKPA